MLARSFNPDTEDEDESEHEEANGGGSFRTDSESEEKNCLFQSFRIQVNSFIHALSTKSNGERFITVTSS